MRVEATAVIQATPDEVFGFITVPENGPRWQEGAISTRVSTTGPVQVGSRMEHEGRWLGMRVSTTAVVTDYEPPRQYGYDITMRLFPKPSRMRYAVEAAADGTRLTLANEVPAGAWMRPFERLLHGSVQAMFERDVARLRAIIESGAPPAADSATGSGPL